MNIGVIGLGRLGICLALNLARNGFFTTGYDIDKNLIKNIDEKNFKTREPYVERLLNNYHLDLTNNLNEFLNKTDLFFVTVRTGSASNGEYDENNVYNLVKQLKSCGVQNQHKSLIINCNVNPGTTHYVQKELYDYNYIVSFNPEWVAQGSIITNQSNPELIVIGAYDEFECDKIETIYTNICENHPKIHHMDPLSAEITKLSLNTCVAGKITFANMIGDFCRNAGADEEKVLRAIGEDSRIGKKYFSYGYSYGGPCFPNDTKAFIKHAEDNGIEPYPVKSIEAYNDYHLDFQVKQFIENNPNLKDLKFGPVSYKQGVNSIENSQQLRFAVKLANHDYNVTIVDTDNVIQQVYTIYGGLFNYESSKQ